MRSRAGSEPARRPAEGREGAEAGRRPCEWDAGRGQRPVRAARHSPGGAGAGALLGGDGHQIKICAPARHPPCL